MSFLIFRIGKIETDEFHKSFVALHVRGLYNRQPIDSFNPNITDPIKHPIKYVLLLMDESEVNLFCKKVIIIYY